MLWTLNLSGGVSSHQLFSGHAKFEVKNFQSFFHLQIAVDSDFFARWVWAPTFFGHTNFEVKIFSEFFPLPSALD